MEYKDLVPHAVACLRRGGLNATYDAEVQWNKQQWRVGRGFETRELALEAAKQISNDLETKLINTGMQIMSKWPIAKP